MEIKDSGVDWIGKIPSEWDISKTKHIFRVICGSTPDSGYAEFWDGHIQWITPADMSDIGYISAGERTITQLGYKSCGTSLIPANSIVISCRAPIGKINLTTGTLCTNQGCKALVGSGMCSKYFFYYYYAEKDELDNLGRGTTFKELSTVSMMNFVVIIPPINEQHQIAAFLDAESRKIDELLSDLRAQIDILMRYKKSLITETVTKGLNPDVPMKDSGIDWIGKIPEGWKIARIKDCNKLQTGKTPPDNIGIEYERSETGIYWYTPSDLDDNTYQLKPAEKSIEHSAVRNNNIKTYPPNSLLFVAIGATVGKIGITSENSFSNQQITALIPYDGMIPRYELYYLVSKSTYMKDNALYTTLPIMNNQYLGGIKVIVPPLDIQCQIVSFLDKKCSQIDALLKDKQAQVDKLESYKKSLIYEYVTGKKRVKGVQHA